MKKIGVVLSLCLLLLVLTPCASWAGLCIQSTGGYCNAYYLGFTPLGGELFLLNGYEYGCGNTEMVTGTMRVAGGTAHISLNGTETGNSVMALRVTVNIGTMTGDLEFNYLYFTASEVTGFGGTDTIAISICSPQALASSSDGPAYKD